MSEIPLQRRRRLLLAALGAPLLLRAPFSFAAECKTAASSILGPAYRPDAPFRSALCPASEPGTKLAMSGTVRAQDSCKPLAGAVLDVWQANAAGEYDWDSPRYRLRGRLRAGTDGAYGFTSIVPGQYGGRARHIHFLVTAPGHEPRITQCYFADDEQAKKDRLVKPSQVVTLEKAGAGMRGRFDLALEPERKADATYGATTRSFS